MYLSAIDEDAYEDLLFQLLRCSDKKQAALVAQKHPSITFRRQKQLAIVRLTAGAKAPLRRIKDLLRQYLYRHISIVMEDQLVIMLDPGQLNKQTMENLEILARNQQFQIGFSFPFEQISFVPSAYRQANLCLDMENQHALVCFEHCLLPYIAKICSKEQDSSFYIHPIITKIKEYDQTYHVEYLETLRAYIDSAGSMKATATALGVHYNTIKYRMSVIEEIAGESIRENGPLLASLYFSLLF